MSGGYDYEPVEDVNQDFYCVICLHLLKDAMQLDCQHGMCNFCLQSLARSSKEKNVEFTCPSCRTPIDENKVHPVGMINRVILSLKVKCVNTRAGCDWSGEVSNMKDHQNNTCEFQNIVCDSNGCLFEARKFEMACHKKSCNFRMVLCDYCQENNVCNNIPVTAGETNKHVSNPLQDHLNLVFKHSLEMKLAIEIAQKEATDAQTRLDATQKELKVMQNEISVMQDNLSATKIDLTDAKSKLSATQNELKVTRREISNIENDMIDKAQEDHKMPEKYPPSFPPPFRCDSSSQPRPPPPPPSAFQ